ncbi:MAG TPA: hypothetical protein VJH20_02740 [Candidatus Nanoarchaeia archaeon]|nr:hypothetical protein [Candidatus Nanoarchaeia archaeon]
MIYIVDSHTWIEYFLGSKKGETLKRLLVNEGNNFLTIDCCLAEIKGFCLRNNADFEGFYKIIRANSTIISLTEYDWIMAAEECHNQRKKQGDFGLIDATILIKQGEFNCKIISGDKHFKGMYNVLFTE